MPGEPGYIENPWDSLVGGRKVASGSRLQLSRAPDGKMIIYTYSESDTNFTNGIFKWNTLPNIKVRAYVADANNLLYDEINITKPPSGQGMINQQINGRATFHFVSPITTTANIGGFFQGCVPNGTASVFLPMTISNSNPYQQGITNAHWFSMVKLIFKGNNGYNSFPPYDAWTGIETEKNNSELFSVSPNPAIDNVQVKLSDMDSGIYTIQVLDVTGKVLFNQVYSNESQINTGAFSSGVYFLSVYKNGLSLGTKKVVIVK
jgi:hypothetical protein